MAASPIHPEIQAEADWRLQPEVFCLQNIGIPSRDAERIVQSINGEHARILQETVERAYDECVQFLHERLTEERAIRVREVLQQLAPYPTIRSQLEGWVRALPPALRLLGAAAS